jgi:hypothetical protein
LPQRVSYTLCSSLSEQDAAHFQISAQDRADILEEVTTELSVYLGMLYHIIEVFKGHDDFADELSKCLSQHLSWYFTCSLPVSLDPPLPVYLISIVSGLRDKSAKGYPVKKVRQNTSGFTFFHSCGRR